MLRTFSPSEAAASVKNKVVTLNNGKFTVVHSIRLCGSVCALPLTHDVHHGWNGRCVNSCFALILKRFTWCRNHTRICFGRSSVVFNWILNNSLHDRVVCGLDVLCFSNSTHFFFECLQILQFVFMKFTNFVKFAIFHLVRMNFALPKLAHMTVVFLHLAHVHFVNFAILQLVFLNVAEICLASQPRLPPSFHERPWP